MSLTIRRVNALPTPLVANSVYLVKNGADLEMHVVGSDINSPVHIPTRSEVSTPLNTAINNVNTALTALSQNLATNYSTTAQVEAAITAAISTIDQTNNAIYVADIAARDALTPAKNVFVLVGDATGDATVTAGSALYFYIVATTTWVKVSEYESMDLTIPNLDILGNLSDVGGVLHYKGAVVGDVVQGTHEW